MEELLKEVALSERKKQQIDSFIQTVTKLIQTVPESPEVEVCSISTLRKASWKGKTSHTLTCNLIYFLISICSGKWPVMAVQWSEGPFPPGAQSNEGQVPHGASCFCGSDRQLPPGHLHQTTHQGGPGCHYPSCKSPAPFYIWIHHLKLWKQCAITKYWMQYNNWFIILK